MNNQDASGSVAAIVVTFNRLNLLQQCLESLQNQTHTLDKIVVIDNGSTDGTAEWLATQPNLVVVRQENCGGAGGQHRGLQVALELGVDWCWLMDDDVLAAPDCLGELFRKGLEHVRMPARISNPFDNYHLPSLSYDMRSPFKRAQRRRKLFRFADATLTEAEEFYYVADIAFEGVLIRRNVLLKAGLPRADFFIAIDDTEYAFRLRYRHNEKIVFVPSARIYRQRNEPVLAGWKLYYNRRNTVIVQLMYGETALARLTPIGTQLLITLWTLVKGDLTTARYMAWALVDGIGMRTVRRFSPS